jgi:hypothetical protein
MPQTPGARSVPPIGGMALFHVAFTPLPDPLSAPSLAFHLESSVLFFRQIAANIGLGLMTLSLQDTMRPACIASWQTLATAHEFCAHRHAHRLA